MGNTGWTTVMGASKATWPSLLLLLQHPSATPCALTPNRKDSQWLSHCEKPTIGFYPNVAAAGARGTCRTVVFDPQFRSLYSLPSLSPSTPVPAPVQMSDTGGCVCGGLQWQPLSGDPKIMFCCSSPFILFTGNCGNSGETPGWAGFKRLSLPGSVVLAASSSERVSTSVCPSYLSVLLSPCHRLGN